MFFCLYYILFYYFISVLALSAAVSPHSTPVAIYLGTFVIGYLASLAYEEQSLSFFLLAWTTQPIESEQTIRLYFLLVSLTYKCIFLKENSFLKEVNQLYDKLRRIASMCRQEKLLPFRSYLAQFTAQFIDLFFFSFTNSTFLPLSCKVTHKFCFLVSNKAIFTKHFPCGIVAHTEALIILTAFWLKYFQTARRWNLPSTPSL